MLYYGVTFYYVLWTAWTNEIRGQGMCYAPFTNFIRCSKAGTDERLEKFIDETSPSVQAAINSCFAANGCGYLSFQEANLHGLLGPTWASRINIIMDLLETAHPAVLNCMVDFLVNFAARKVETCIKAQNVDGTSRFKMPPPPSFENLDLARLRTAAVNRIFVNLKAAKCSKSQNDAELRSLMNCVRIARSDDREQLCQTVENCQNQHIPHMCNQAYTAIKQAACRCFDNAWRSMNSENNQYMKDIVSLFIKGQLVKEFRTCSAKLNIPVPETKLRLANEAIKQSVRDYLANGLPNDVRQISAQMITQIAAEIQMTLCGDCAQMSSARSAANDAAAVRAVARALQNPNQSQGAGLLGVLQRGLDGLIG